MGARSFCLHGPSHTFPHYYGTAIHFLGGLCCRRYSESAKAASSAWVRILIFTPIRVRVVPSVGWFRVR